MTDFKELGLSVETLEILEKKGYTQPSEIQIKTIPILLNKSKDIIGQSQTGTGKTAAFGLPIIETLLKKTEKTNKIKALILSPTRELAIQIGNELNSFLGKRGLKIFTIYGGQSYITEKRAIKNGIDILVGTPGRIIDHMNNGFLDFSSIEYFVLDEADEMLKMGFIDEVQSILQNCPSTKTTLFFSATMPQDIMRVAKKYMNDHEVLSVKTSQLTTTLTDQYYYVIRNQHKLELLGRIMDMEDDFYGIIFCKTKSDVDELMGLLSARGYNVDSIHGDIPQNRREKTIRNFKNGEIRVLVATDVASRGLDVNGLSHVINYAIPNNAEDYTHRIGRTGRAGKKGTAITFVMPSEVRRISQIMSATKARIIENKIPEIQQVMDAQRNNVKRLVGEIIDQNRYQDYTDLAHEILKLDKPEVALAATLASILKQKLNVSRYNEISQGFATNHRSDRGGDRSERSERGDRGGYSTSSRPGFGKEGYVRLVLRKGKMAGMDKFKMIDWIANNASVDKRFITDVQVTEDTSYFSTKKDLANKIIKHINSKSGKPIVRLLKRDM